MSDYGTPPPPPPPPPPPSGGFEHPGYGPAPSGPQLASWIQRVGAYLLDYVLVLPFYILAWVFTPKLDSSAGVVRGGSVPLQLLMYLIAIAVWFYNRCYLAGKGQSFGKKQLGLVLVAESTGQPIGTGKAFLRDLAHILDSLICYVGWFFPLWDQKRQTIADKVVTTVVPIKA